MDDAFQGVNKIQYHDYYKYRISYITETDLNLIFVFVTGLTDNFESIKKELIRCKKDFLNLFEDILHHRFDAKTFEVFDPTIDSIHRNLRPKISLVGFSGVGKTTTTRLIKAEEIPMQHIPTITGDIATIKIGKLHFHLWDFAGQEQFSYLWTNFIKGSDAVLLITDSTLENVEKSKFFLELIKEQAEHAHTAVIGNKQDLPDAMRPEQIEKILGLKTYSMIANDSNNRNKMIQIIADVLEMSAEISPLLKPLLERDQLTSEVSQALESGDFSKAAILFEKISDLCLELGDDSLGREFYEKANKIKDMLKKVGALEPTPAPAEAPKTPEPPPAPAETPKAPEPPPVPTEALKALGLTQVPTEALKAPATLKTPGPPPAPAETPKAPEPPPVPTEALKAPATLKTPGPPPAPAEAPKAPEPPPVPTEALKSPATLKTPGPPPAPAETPKAPEPPPVPTEALKAPATLKTPGIPQSLIPKKLQPKSILGVKINSQEPEILMNPKIAPTKLGLQLNPEDFMIKQRPKSIGVIPKDAKNKLKTSPFAHVTNPTKPTAPVAVPPTQLIKPKAPTGPIQLKKPVIPGSPKKPATSLTPVVPIKLNKASVPVKLAPPIKTKAAPTPEATPAPAVPMSQDTSAPSTKMDPQQKASLEQTLMDLKIKKANLSKMSLDFDMKELIGEISKEELDEKKQRLEILEKKLYEQIQDLQEMLK